MRVAAAAVIAVLVAGCEISLEEPVAPESDPRAVVFEFNVPDFAGSMIDGEMPATRTIPSITAFPNGAIIHVIGTFTLQSGTETYAYGTYVYNKDTYRWTPEGQTLIWPEHAETADFEAFYLPGDNGAGNVARLDITADGTFSSDLFALAPPYDTDKKIIHTDPLQANKTGVPYGAAVQMRFNHVCSRLILTDLGDMETDECWLEYKSSENEKKDKLYNGYRFTIDATSGKYKGKIEFVEYDEMKSETGYRYIRALREEDELTLSNNEKTTVNVNALCFYLAPGQYKGCQVFYRDEKPFLMLNVDKLDETPEGATQPGLQPGHSYTLNIRTAQGVVNEEYVDPETEWQDDETSVIPQDLVEFMKALSKGQEYECTVDGETRKLIERVEGGVRINCNINFDNKNMYKLFNEAGEHFGTEGGNDGCDLGSVITIYGNHKRFINMASPLFNKISGTVLDLQIEDADISIPEEYFLFDEGEDVHSARNIGALTSTLNGGHVENVLLNKVKVTAKIPDMSEHNGHNHGTAQPSVGALVGESISGAIQNINIQGSIQVIVQQKEGVDKALTSENFVHVGGLIGRQRGGSTSNISTLGTGTTLTVTVNLQAQIGGHIEVGGVIGFTESNVSDISLMNCTTTVSAEDSQCDEIYVGGIVGYANYANTDSRQMIRDAFVQGTVTGGTATTSELTIKEDKTTTTYNTIGHSTTGGMAGTIIAFSMVNCRFNGTVNAGRRAAGGENFVLVSTGGGIGRIKDAEERKATVNSASHVFDCTARAIVNKPTDDNAKNLTGEFIGQQNIAAEEYRLSPTTPAPPPKTTAMHVRR